VSENSDSRSEQKALDREFLVARAAEARAERELREKILRWAYTAAGVFVVLFIIAMLFL
jgi:hypothetical protein